MYKSQPSVWVYLRDGVHVIIPVFVNNTTIAAKSQDTIQCVKHLLQYIKGTLNYRPGCALAAPVHEVWFAAFAASWLRMCSCCKNC